MCKVVFSRDLIKQLLYYMRFFSYLESGLINMSWAMEQQFRAVIFEWLKCGIMAYKCLVLLENTLLGEIFRWHIVSFGFTVSLLVVFVTLDTFLCGMVLFS